MGEENTIQQYEAMKTDREQYIENSKRKGTLLALAFVMLAVLYAVFGVIQVSTHTEKVNAIVVEVQSKIRREHSRRHAVDREVYCPVFEYTYNGTRYTSAAGKYSRWNSFSVGDTAEIYIAPDNPDDFLIAGERTVFVDGFVFLIMLGAGFYFLFAVLPVKMQQKNKERNTRNFYR